MQLRSIFLLLVSNQFVAVLHALYQRLIVNLLACHATVIIYTLEKVKAISVLIWNGVRKGVWVWYVDRWLFRHWFFMLLLSRLLKKCWFFSYFSSRMMLICWDDWRFVFIELETSRNLVIINLAFLLLQYRCTSHLLLPINFIKSRRVMVLLWIQLHFRIDLFNFNPD